MMLLNCGITVDQFRDLVAQIRQEVRNAGLEPGDAEIVDADVTVIEEEAASCRRWWRRSRQPFTGRSSCSDH